MCNLSYLSVDTGTQPCTQRPIDIKSVRIRKEWNDEND